MKRSLSRSGILPASILLLTFLIIACAEIHRPPGGEIDRTGPFLVDSYPAPGATGVESSDKIILTFSEPVVEPRAGQAVYISPRPETDPKIRFKGDRITIELAETFREDQTYIVAVSAEVADLRRNRLDTNVVIAFSTGDVIDTGSISGEVTTAGKPAGGLVMALYEASYITDSVIYDSIYATYFTTSNKNGQFAFRYLPDGNYYLIGFDDRNRDSRFNPSAERFALSDRPVQVGGEWSLESLSMALTELDSLKPEIISAATTSDNLIRMRISSTIAVDPIKNNPGSIILRSVDDSTETIAARGFAESDLDETGIITAYFGDLPTGNYALELTPDSGQPLLEFESIAVEPQEDKKGPAITKFTPDGKPQFVSQVHIAVEFSEPVNLSGETFMLWQDEAKPLSLTLVWPDPFHLQLETEALSAGHEYRLDVTEFGVTDMAGNVLGDSLMSYAFSTLNDDSLGWISGEFSVAMDDRASSPVVLSFKNVADNREFDLRMFETIIVPRTFIKQLPPGEYVISAFVDQDNDGIRSEGTLFPRRMAETEANYPDTISVRARFETAGIDFQIK